MALLASRGFDTPSLPAQGGQRRFPFLNISRDIPNADKQRRYTEFYDGAGSWSRVERIIARVEAGPDDVGLPPLSRTVLRG